MSSVINKILGDIMQHYPEGVYLYYRVRLGKSHADVSLRGGKLQVFQEKELHGEIPDE